MVLDWFRSTVSLPTKSWVNIKGFFSWSSGNGRTVSKLVPEIASLVLKQRMAMNEPQESLSGEGIKKDVNVFFQKQRVIAVVATAITNTIPSRLRLVHLVFVPSLSLSPGPSLLPLKSPGSIVTKVHVFRITQRQLRTSHPRFATSPVASLCSNFAHLRVCISHPALLSTKGSSIHRRVSSKPTCV